MKGFKHKSLALVVMIFIISVMIFTLFSKKDEISFKENRELKRFPKLSFSSLFNGTFSLELQEYFSDHIIYRDSYIEWNANLITNIGEKVIDSVYIANNRLIKIDDSDNFIDESVIETINNFTERYQSSFYFLAVPSSTAIYNNQLPGYMSNNKQVNRIDKFYSGLNSNIKKIDAYNILNVLSDNYIYYRNDSKWTSYGAYCVYRTAIQKLGFLPVAYDKFTIEHITSNFRGDLYHKSQYKGIQADFIDAYYNNDLRNQVYTISGYDKRGFSYEKELYDKSLIDSKDMYDIYLGEDIEMIKIKTQINNDKKILVIKDEYADCFIPFLISHYSEVMVISSSYSDFNFSEYINVNDYEQVMFLFGIDSLLDKSRVEILE